MRVIKRLIICLPPDRLFRAPLPQLVSEPRVDIVWRSISCLFIPCNECEWRLLSISTEAEQLELRDCPAHKFLGVATPSRSSAPWTPPSCTRDVSRSNPRDKGLAASRVCLPFFGRQVASGEAGLPSICLNDATYSLARNIKSAGLTFQRFFKK